jgi:sugar O-acyltransferase, sialic acid O-acetyltransferase NeuD family
MILAIYGSSGMGKEVCDLAEEHEAAKWDNIVFVDDLTESSIVYGHATMAYKEFKLKYMPSEVRFIIAQGEPEIKKLLFERIRKDGFQCATIVHPDTEISSSSHIGEGVVIFKGCYVSSEATIGNNCILLSYTCIAHNVVIEDYCQLSAMVLTGGFDKIGTLSYIGAGAIIREGITVGNQCIVGQGAVVLSNVADKLVVAGNPARGFKTNDSGRVFHH